ncbi:PLDc N-terminal domain-containing protein [Salegentibacter sp. JZCK2]|uniref:PLD nuclease N-terminal domain-containing protein n=1 Tax=Salegentibacter tibetensis TaxID=2873600 RepID=UPI001CCC726C|nr:PLD nuclease N-terminal domain-containing protein [Salegentibacter tibetensis]MBZ9729405.1 PLDc N-terminal domain-containing protein [Salegentibacter tibetensis]
MVKITKKFQAQNSSIPCPEVDVNNIEIKKDELMVHTAEEETYKVNLGSRNSIKKQEFLNEIKAKNPGMTETYVTESNELFSSFLLLYQALYLIIPLLILVHIILLWIALRRIIRSQIESTEKLVYTIIALFFTFFGPIIYLTTGKR